MGPTLATPGTDISAGSGRPWAGSRAVPLARADGRPHARVGQPVLDHGDGRAQVARIRSPRPRRLTPVTSPTAARGHRGRGNLPRLGRSRSGDPCGAPPLGFTGRLATAGRPAGGTGRAAA